MTADTARLQALLNDAAIAARGRLDLADHNDFKNRHKPDEIDFMQLFKSFLNKVDDGIVVDNQNIGIGYDQGTAIAEKLAVDGAVKIEGDTTITPASGNPLSGNLNISGNVTIGEGKSLKFGDSASTFVNSIREDRDMGGANASDNALATQAAIQAYIEGKFTDDFVGCIMPFAWPSFLNDVGIMEPPRGWLFCNGYQFHKDEEDGKYLKLYDKIGIHYGSGSGAPGEFNVPNLQGMFIRGMDYLNTGSDPNRGDRRYPDGTGATGNIIGGEQDDEIKRHKHTSSDKHSDVIVDVDGTPHRAWWDAGASWKEIYYQIKYRTQDTSYTGNFHETRPKNAVYMYCIKY